MLIDCVEDASIAMCENAQALASIQVWMNRLDHREPEHFIGDKIKCTVIYLCPCVFFSRLEGIGGLHFRIISCVPLCNHDAPITSQVSNNVFKY